MKLGMNAESISAKDIIEIDFLIDEDGTYFILTYLEQELMCHLNKMIDGIPTQDIKVYSNASILVTHKRRKEAGKFMEENDDEDVEVIN
jgi:hypothetical protein